MDRARLLVDFNELVEHDLVLLSKSDTVRDSEGNELLLTEGMFVHLYEPDPDLDGTPNNLLAEGVVERNNPQINGSWSASAKWCCRINHKGIYHERGNNT